MKSNLKKILFALGAAFFFIAAGRDHAQQNPLGGMKDLKATDFTSNQYFEPPNEQQVKMRLSGSAAAALPNGAQDIRDLRIEKFSVAGTTEMVLRAPQCTYALMDGVANSAGHIELTAQGGKLHVEGDGFLWRQNEQSLSISNRVRTTIAIDIFSEKKTAL